MEFLRLEEMCLAVGTDSLKYISVNGTNIVPPH